MKFKLSKSITKKIKVCIALTLVISMLVQFASNGYVFAINEYDTIAVYNVGVNNDNVIATLTKDGTMTLSGSGETSDYTANTMPFADNIDKITNIKIEDGVTSIGEYLFFGCKNLNDKLELPSTITSIGDYAFSGESKETAPSFTYITNDFKSADISVPVKAQTEETKPEETTNPQTTDSQNDATDQNAVEEKTDTTDGSIDVSSSQDTGSDTATVEDTQTPQSNGTEKTMEIKTITEQEIGVGIFIEGQSGGYKAETTNESFRTAVESAGYIEADRFVEVKLDGVITQHLAVKDGKMIIPSFPSFGIVPPDANDAYKKSTFVGWIIDGTTYQPKETCEIADSKDTIELTSSWKTEWAIDPQVKTEAKEEISVYSIIDANTGSALEKVEDYSINVQWQINTTDKDDESAWENIKGATSLKYEREVVAGDTKSFFRAQISIEKQSKTRLLNSSDPLTTEPVSGINSLTPITVTYTSNGGSGTMEQESYGDNSNFKPSECNFIVPNGQVFIGWQVTSLSNIKATYPSGTKVLAVGDIIKPNTIEFSLEQVSSSIESSIQLQAQWERNTIYYVNQETGLDTNDGSENSPFNSLGAAYNALPESGIYETNIIVLTANYTSKDVYLENADYGKNATIRGKTGNNVQIDMHSLVELKLVGDTKFENLSFTNGTRINISQYAHTCIIGKDVSISVTNVFGEDYGVPSNTQDINLLPTFDTKVDTKIKDKYGKNGKTPDNPIISQIDSAQIKIGRWGALGRNAADGDYGAISSNKTHVVMNLNDGWVGLLCAGAISDQHEYGDIKINIKGGYIYNLTGANNPYEQMSVLHGKIEFNIDGGEIATLNCGAMGRRISTITQTEADIKLNMTNGYVHTIYGGGSTGKLTGNVNMNISGGKIDTLFGGGHGYSEFVPANQYSANAATITGDVTITLTGGTVTGNLYVGGKGYTGSKSSGSIIGDSKLEISGNTIVKGDVYTGGLGISSDETAAQITGSSTVIIDGGSIEGSVYGGGEIGKIGVKSQVVINQGVIKGSIYGAGNKVGVPISEISIGANPSIAGNIYGGSNNTGTTTESIVNINGKVNANVYGGGKGSSTTVKTSNLNINAGANISGNAFGGSEEGVVTASNVTLNGGYVANVFGGSDKANITGSTKITSSTDSEAGNIYAGCNASGYVTNPTMNLAGKADNVFAGGNATDKTIADISGTSTINVTSNQDNIITNVYGGANNTGLVSNSVINIQGYAENVFGGGLGAETVTNTPTVNVKTNGNITGNLYGGGEEGSTHGTTVNIEAGTVKNAFAGGHKAGVDGAIKISSSTGSTVTNMYGGSNESGIVNSPTVTVAGNVENVYGGGLGVGTTTTSPIVNIETNANVTGNVFGGGDLGNVSNPTVNLNGGTVNNAFAGGNAVGVTGTVALNTKDGSTATNIYGGSNSAGTVESPVLSIVGNATNIYGGGLGAKTTTKNPSIAVTKGTITNIYGGGEEGLTSGTNKLIIEGGTVTNVFGAGKSVGADDTDIAINNQANVTNAYGGSESSGDTIKSNLKIDAPVKNVYGGGLGANTTVKTTYVKTTTAANVTDIYGGSKDGAVTDATLVIQGPVQGSIYGGGFGKTSVIDGDTWVYVANNIKGNIYGGGNEGAVNGNTHVDIANGIIGTSNDENTGNIFGGSNQAKVQGNTKVHIGSYVVAKPIGAEIPTTKSIDIKGTVFGGGNTTATGKAFDASDPYVIGTATVQVGGVGDESLKIEKSIFGDGNKCVVNGDKIVTIKNYIGTNTSIQRATTLTLETSELELKGETDSANLVTTSAYSLNRIDNLILKGGTTLKLQNGVNLVMGFESQNANGNPQTSDEANGATGNKLYIQQGQHVEFRINEDVSRPGYGDIKGFAQLGRYYVDANNKPIDKDAQGVYVMGSYYTNESDNTNSGFVVADNENFGSETEKLTKGDKITPTTNSSSWRNWLLGSSIKSETVNMIVSDQPGNGKIEPIKGWAADGSIYRVDPSTLTISDDSSYTIVDPDKITSSSDENTIGLSIETGQTGWLEQVKAGYIDSATKKIIPYKTNETLSTDNSLDMRSIVNTSQQPVINIKLYNSDKIESANNEPITVTFSIDKITQQPDGSEVKTGTIKVTVNITKETTETYQDILISQGKVYDRAEQSFIYDNLDDVATSVSKGSSITAQFAEKVTTPTKVTNYGLLFTSAKTVNKVDLPAGTKILMIDRSGSMPVYYNYTVPAGGNDSIALIDFVKNGTSDNFAVPIESITKSNFLFVVDFADASTFENADICMTLKSTYEGGTSSDKKVRFAVTGTQRQYEMSSNQDNSANETTAIPSYRMNGTFGMTLNTKVVSGGEGGTDTTGSDKQMAAKVQLKLMNSTTGAVLPIPNGWQILSNGTRYSTSGDSATIVLANSLTATNSDIYVIMSNMGDIPAGSYELEISLVAGAMANYPSETLNEKTVKYKFKLTDDRYSIKATIRDENKLVISKTDDNKTMEYDILRVSNGSLNTSDVTTKVTLWKKQSGGYEQVAINENINSITGVTIDAIKNYGTLPWSTYKTVNVILNKDIEVGSYQLRYDITQMVTKDGNTEEVTIASEVSPFIITSD